MAGEQACADRSVLDRGLLTFMPEDCYWDFLSAQWQRFEAAASVEERVEALRQYSPTPIPV
jgi:hypothetical protein